MAEEMTMPPEGSFIGARIRHYWSGDDAWYEGRIVGHEAARNVHVVRYDDDEYHEIQFEAENELVMLGGDVVVAKVPGHGSWPAHEFKLSAALDASGLLTVPRPKAKKIVLFFATDESAAVPAGGCTLFDMGKLGAEIARLADKKTAKGDLLRKALELAEAETRSRASLVDAWRRGEAIPRGATVHPVGASDVPLALLLPAPVDAAAAGVMALAEEGPTTTAAAGKRSLGRPRKGASPKKEAAGRKRPRKEAKEGIIIAEVAVGAAASAATTTMAMVSRKKKERAPRKKKAPSNKCAACRGGETCNVMTNAARCSRCETLYHLACWGGPEIKRAPAALSRGPKAWLCADCLTCQGCGVRQRALEPGLKVAKVRLERLKGGAESRDLCRSCSEVFRKGLFCPQCESPYSEEENLINCDKCNSWTHWECEGFSTAEALPDEGAEFWCVLCKVYAARGLIAALRHEDELALFAEPVDTTKLPTYTRVVKEPMDLLTMEHKAAAGLYTATQQLRADVELMCANAIRFNRAGDRVWAEAVRFFDAATVYIDAHFDRGHRSQPTLHAADIAVARAEQSERRIRERAFSKRAASIRKDMFAGRAVSKVVDVKRWVCSDPASCVHVAEVLCPSRAHAIEASWLDVCVVCASTEVVPETASFFGAGGEGGGDDGDDGDGSSASASASATATVARRRPVDAARDPIHGGELLFCIDCGESMHAFCASAPLAGMSRAARATWRCPNCKLCELCGLCKPGDELRLLYCDVCDKGYHMECVLPALTDAPAGRWVCELCVDCRFCAQATAAAHHAAPEAPDSESESSENGEDKAQPPPPPAAAALDQGVPAAATITTEAAAGAVVSRAPAPPTPAPQRRCWSSRADACRACSLRAASLDGSERAPLQGACAALMACSYADEPFCDVATSQPCPSCSARFHPRCFDRFADEGTCARCSESLGTGASVATHLGDDEAAWAVAVAASKLQRSWHDILVSAPLLAPAPAPSEGQGGEKSDGADAPRAAPPRRRGGRVVTALRGWEDYYARQAAAAATTTTTTTEEVRIATLEALGSWTDSRACVLCKRSGDCREAGRLLAVDGIMWVHAKCALYSSEVFEVERNLCKVRAAITRSKTLRCTHCGVGGATMGCSGPNCSRNYHFRCGAADGAVVVESPRVPSVTKIVYCAECFAKCAQAETLLGMSGPIPPVKKKTKTQQPQPQQPQPQQQQQQQPPVVATAVDHLSLLKKEDFDTATEASGAATPHDDDEDAGSGDGDILHAGEILDDGDNDGVASSDEALIRLSHRTNSPAGGGTSTAPSPPPDEAPSTASSTTDLPAVGGGTTFLNLNQAASRAGKEDTTEELASPPTVAPTEGGALLSFPSPPPARPSDDGAATLKGDGQVEPQVVSMCDEAPAGGARPEDEQAQAVAVEEGGAVLGGPPAAQGSDASNGAAATMGGEISEISGALIVAAPKAEEGAPGFFFTSQFAEVSAEERAETLRVEADKLLVEAAAAREERLELQRAEMVRARRELMRTMRCDLVGDRLGDIRLPIRVADIDARGGLPEHDAYAFFVGSRDSRSVVAVEAPEEVEVEEEEAADEDDEEEEEAPLVVEDPAGGGPSKRTRGGSDARPSKKKAKAKAKAKTPVAKPPPGASPAPLISAEHMAWLDDRVRKSRALGPSFRLGALVVLDVGRVAPAGYVGFHTTDRIYPLGYRATRIFWSATERAARTVYLCEVAAKRDTTGAGGGGGGGGGDEKRTERYAAVFRITQLDMLSETREAATPRDVVAALRADVARLNSNARDGACWDPLPSESASPPSSSASTHQSAAAPSALLAPLHVARPRRHDKCFGLGEDGCGFFGLSVAAIRARIEDLPGAAGAALLDPPYAFCYVLPSEEQILAAQRAAASRAAEVRPNPSGCARTEPRLGHSAAAMNEDRVTRSLVRITNADDATAASSSSSSNNNSAPITKSPPSSSSDSRSRSLTKAPFATVVDDNREKYRAMKAEPQGERVDVRRSHIHGYGLYCVRDVRKDEFIVEYVGEVVRQCVGDKRERYYDERLGVGSCYLFRLDADAIVDATRRGSVARFINHCCRPNAYAKVVHLDSERKKIVIIALQDLKAGDEVMYDYKFPIEDEKVPCYCGAPNCRGVMN